MTERLVTGAHARTTGSTARAAVVCVNGGCSRDLPGTWSASVEWLVRRLAPRFPPLGFVEVRYRVRSWNRLDWCTDDARAAVRAAGAPRTLLLGFSMGGAVAVRAADEPGVAGVLGLAPWLPERLDLSGLAGRRLAVVHGSLDRPLPGLPGVSAAQSHRAVERARGLGAEAVYTRIPGAGHAIALRAPGGRPVPLPRAGAWSRHVAAELERFAGSG